MVDNPMADMIMAGGMSSMFGPNPYSTFQGKIPIARMDTRPQNAPTDAMGNPIQSYQDAMGQSNAWNAANPPGTTLTSNPVTGGGGGWGGVNAGLAAAQRMGATGAAGTPLAGRDMGILANSPLTPGAQTAIANNPQYAQLAGWQALSEPEQSAAGYTFGDPYINMTTAGMQGGGGSSQSSQPTNPVDLNQAYLDALARPQGSGRMVTPGATVPAASQWGAQPSVLSSFLAQNKGGMGAGNYTNMPFFNALSASNLGSTGNPPVRST